MLVQYKKQYTWLKERTERVKDQFVYDDYKITYRGLPSGLQPTSPKTFKYNTATFSITAPSGEKPGYTFVGWYTKAQGGEKVTKVTKGTAKDLVLYARFEKTVYNVSYKNLPNELKAPSQKTYTSTDSFSLSNPSGIMRGRTFYGWYTKSTGGTQISRIEKGRNKNTTLYARILKDSGPKSLTKWAPADSSFKELKEGQTFKYTGKPVEPVKSIVYAAGNHGELGDKFDVIYLNNVQHGKAYALVKSKTSEHSDAFIYTFNIK